jgi:hypothetical protein
VSERAQHPTRTSLDLNSVTACRAPRSFSPFVLSSPLSLSSSPLFNHHAHILFDFVTAEARHDACGLYTHRPRRLARYNRDSTSTTHLPSVTPSCERATTAWCKIWTLHTSLQASQDAFRPYSCRSDTIATVASDPCSYHGSVCCG